MPYLLDTNVVSELVKPSPGQAVVAWVAAQSVLNLSLSVLTLGEIEQGIARLPAGVRRSALEVWAHTELPGQFAGRLLACDLPVALAWGRLVAATRLARREPPAIDGLLLATASAHGLTLVTRNVTDCAGRGVPVLDPWTGVVHP